MVINEVPVLAHGYCLTLYTSFPKAVSSTYTPSLQIALVIIVVTDRGSADGTAQLGETLHNGLAGFIDRRRITTGLIHPNNRDGQAREVVTVARMNNVRH